MVGSQAAKPLSAIAPGRFAHFLGIDWSGAAGSRHPGIALALCSAAGGTPRLVERAPWSREAVLDYLRHELPANTLIGMDLGMALPHEDAGGYFPGLADGPDDARGLWRLVDETCANDADLGVSAFVDDSRFAPFFRRHGGREGAHFHLRTSEHGRGRFRVTERAQEALGCKPYSNFNLVGAAQVGKASLSGMRLLHRLDGAIPVWPFDPLPATGSVIVEIYSAIAAMAAGRSASRSKIRTSADLDTALAALDSQASGLSGEIDDHRADAMIIAAWLRTAASKARLWHPATMTHAIARTEGWTFGAP